VATAGDVNGDGYSDVIVGVHRYDNGESDEGRAYVYLGSAAGLSAVETWTAESNQASASLGVSVGTAGDVNGDGYSDVIVGADLYDNGEPDEGRAYVYLGSAAGLGAVEAWTAESDQADAWFGHGVATAGDVNGDGYSDVIVGAHVYDNGESDEGRAYVYLGSAAGLSAVEAWTAGSDQPGASFGRSVAMAGDVNGDGYSDVIVGAHLYDEDHSFDVGRAYVYLGSAAGLSAVEAWTAEGDQTDGQFGFSVATAGDVNGDGYSDVIVGARLYDNGETDEGRANVYLGSAAGVSAVEAWTAEGGQADAWFGRSVAMAGDVNGDGYSDVIVGARRYDNGQDGEGRAYVYLGSAAGLSAVEAWTAEGDQVNSGLGFSVATAGDVNGDGYSDVIIGAMGYTNGEAFEGRAYVYLGSAAGLGAVEAWTAESNQAGASFGVSVGTAGDVNGDGYSDVIIGADDFDNGESDEGRAYVYLGSAAGPSAVADWTAESDQAGARLGRSVATAGDVNGDGYSDVIVGAWSYDGLTLDNAGRAYVYLGSAAGLSSVEAWTTEGDQWNGRLGISVATAGDVNGDGYSDVIVGAHFYDNGEADEGRVYVHFGSAAGLSAVEAWTAESDQAGARLGRAETAGDVNGDGYSDVIAGAYLYDNGETDEGRAYVYLGSAAGLSTVEDWTAESNAGDASFGFAVATAGDVNGDGYSDVIVGALLWGGGEGRAYVYYGNDGAGLSLRPQQRRADDSAPIAPLGTSGSLESFRLALLGRTPFGRGKVKLEWEVKPLGTSFDGTGTSVSSSWMDTGTAGTAVNELVSSLANDTVYHWRARLRYDPVTVPFQPAGRWLTVPWNGQQEADLRTIGAAVSAGRVPDGDVVPGIPLTLDKASGDDITLTWSASCDPADNDYGIYEGTVGTWTSHSEVVCTDTGSDLTEQFTPGSGNRYYLVVPSHAGSEGSYGTDSNASGRPQGGSACFVQSVAVCE